MHPFSEEKIIDSWLRNANPWSEAVRNGMIESRRLVTNDAIIQAILNRAPRTVLDVGCGEGWLVRELADKVEHVSGIDVVPDLIARAMEAGGGHFYTASYEDIAEGMFDFLSDVVVCNFSLLGKESVETLFKAIPSLLAANGAFIVQTLHPLASCGTSPYQDGWREGSWDGFSDDFTDPAPWYFRTLDSWVSLFLSSGLRLLEIHEPLHPMNQAPASVIFVAQAS